MKISKLFLLYDTPFSCFLLAFFKINNNLEDAPGAMSTLERKETKREICDNKRQIILIALTFCPNLINRTEACLH